MSAAEVERVLEEKRAWIEAERRAQVPLLGLEGRAVSESEARVAARELVSALAEEEAERLGVEYARIRIGGQRTLWGSCSAPRCSTTSSCTSSATYASRTTRAAFGRSSSGGGRAGANSATGSASTGRSCSPSNQLTSDGS